MPRSSAQAHVRQRSDANSDSRWSRIGINAVAAAHACKGNGKVDCEEDKSKKGVFPFAETDYATD